ncbi:hypothetical protein RvY_03980 [Ramazzottius varieornatus]|uniref:Uncharacterized protein n=1 Tax=Ramazzottius varieornatus TaxID=947166 RepID=A0A1D1UPY6_RAMVA|nr:hypothetical protein RvY_03980 [Ramazzottius varieornatus]
MSEYHRYNNTGYYALPLDACPNTDVTIGRAAEALFKAVVQSHGQSSFGVALTAKMGSYSYGPPSPALEALKTFAPMEGINIGIAYGSIDNSSP